jgi:hypothetical protein
MHEAHLLEDERVPANDHDDEEVMAAVLDEDLLRAFESSLRAIGAPIVKHWASGLDDAAIDELVVPLDLRLPEEARVWWRWRNGTRSDAPGRERCIMPGRDLLSLQAALVGTADFWAVLPELWGIDRRLLKLVGEQPRIWIDGSGPRSKPAAIYTQNDGSEPPRLALPSMGALVTIWTRLIDTGVVIATAGAGLEFAPGVSLASEIGELQIV